MLDLYTLIYNQIMPIIVTHNYGFYSPAQVYDDATCATYVDHYPEDQKKVYPYAEIKFPNSLPNNSFSDNNLLEVDIWDDKATDIREIEGITDAIHKALNRLQYNDAVMNVSINRNTPHRLSLPDPIIHIQRRQLRYIVTAYYK